MAQHFLLSARARTLSLRDVYKGGEEQAYETFCKLRWPETDGTPVCPRCGTVGAYAIKNRRKFECKACKHHFSVTSGTLFSSHKKDFCDLLAAILIGVNAVKGVSMLQLARDVNCQYKTAFVLAHKIREAIKAEMKDILLSGTVEVDGAYFCGHVRPANLADERIDRRRAENQSPKRRVVIVARQRRGKTLVTVKKTEAEGVQFVREVVKKKSKMHADEAAHWNALHKDYRVRRIVHADAYSLAGAAPIRLKVLSRGYGG